jgi:hypothetical protein
LDGIAVGFDFLHPIGPPSVIFLGVADDRFLARQPFFDASQDGGLQGLEAIALDVLKRDGVLNFHGTTEWSPYAVRRILENPIYIGKPTWNKRTYIKDQGKRIQLAGKPEDLIIQDAPHLRIVPQELWDRVQALRAGRGEAKFGKGKRSYSFKSAEKYLLVGKLRCNVCNGNMAIGQNNMDGSPRVVCGRGHRRMGCTQALDADLP